MEPQNELDTDIEIELPDIEIDQGETDWKEILALTTQMLLGVGSSFAAWGLGKYQSKIESDINNLDDVIKNKKVDIKKDVTKQFNEDLRNLGEMYIRADQWNATLSQIPQNTQKYEQQIAEWQQNSWLDWANKYSYSDQEIKDLESNITALEGETGLGLPKILRQQIKDIKYYKERLLRLGNQLTNKLKDYTIDFKNMSLNELYQKFPETRKLITQIRENPLSLVPVDELKKLFSNAQSLLENDIIDNYKKIMVTKNPDQLLHILSKYGINPEDYLDKIDDIKNIINNPTDYQSIKKIFSETFPKFEKQLEGMQYDAINTFEDFQNLVREHPELSEFEQSFLKEYNPKVEAEMKNLLNKSYKQIIQSVQDTKKYLIEDIENIQSLDRLKQIFPDLSDIFADLKRYYKDIIDKAEINARNIGQSVWKQLTKDINLEDSVIINRIKQVTEEGSEVYKILDKIIGENTNTLENMAKELGDQFPESKKFIQDALNTGKIADELKNIPEMQEFIKLVEKPFDGIVNIGIEQLKKDMIDRYNKGGELFYEIQLPESDIYNFDFVNATEQEKNRYKRIYQSKNLWKYFQDKKINVSDFIKRGEEIDKIWERAQELKNNPDINYYKRQLKQGVRDILLPFLNNIKGSNKEDLIKYIKTFKENPWEQEIMLYNMNGNDPYLYLKVENTLKDDILKAIEDTTKIGIQELTDHHQEALKLLAKGQFTELANLGIKIGKDALDKGKQLAKYYLLTEPYDMQTAPLTIKYAEVPKRKYILNGNIFQDTQANSNLGTLQKGIIYLKQDKNSLINKLRDIKPNQQIQLDRKRFETYIPDNIKNNTIQQWYEDLGTYIVDYDDAQNILKNIDQTLTYANEILKNELAEKKLLDTLTVTGKVPEEVKRYEPDTQQITFERINIPIVKDDVLPANKQVTEELAKRFNYYEKQLQTAKQEDIPNIIAAQQQDRKNILGQARKQYEFEKGSKLEGQQRVTIKQLDPRLADELQRLGDWYSNKYRIGTKQTGETKDSGALMKSFTNPIKDVKEKETKIAYFKGELNKLLDQYVSDESINKYNTTYNKIRAQQEGRGQYKANDWKKYPDRIPKRYDIDYYKDKDITNQDIDGKITWHDWAWKNYGNDVAKDFERDSLSINPQYNDFRTIFNWKQGNAGDNYIIDQIKEMKGSYNYDDSLINNFKKLDDGQQFQLLRNGLPNDLSKDFEEYITFKQKSKGERTLAKQIIFDLIKQQTKQEEK